MDADYRETYALSLLLGGLLWGIPQLIVALAGGGLASTCRPAHNCKRQPIAGGTAFHAHDLLSGCNQPIDAASYQWNATTPRTLHLQDTRGGRHESLGNARGDRHRARAGAGLRADGRHGRRHGRHGRRDDDGRSHDGCRTDRRRTGRPGRDGRGPAPQRPDRPQATRGPDRPRPLHDHARQDQDDPVPEAGERRRRGRARPRWGPTRMARPRPSWRGEPRIATTHARPCRCSR